MKKRIIGIIALLFAISMAFSACRVITTTTYKKASTPPLPPVIEPLTLTIAAAASLETILEKELLTFFRTTNPYITVEVTYDSSGKLQTQIEEGLSADIFFSAATKQMDALVEGGLIDSDSVVPLLQNEVVLISPTGSKLNVTSFEDIIKAESIVIGDPESVPAGQYAKEVLTNLGVWDAIQGKISFANNVTEVLTQVAEGSADLGIVYATDAATVPEKVSVLATAPPESLTNKVIYPIGILSNSEQKKSAEKFIEFLQSDFAKVLFEKYGFVVLPA